jgi:predicted dinucleotide-binding enzyme
LSNFEKVRVAASAQVCIDACGVVVLATPWQEFREIPVAQWAREDSPRAVIDCWRALTHLDGVEGVRYLKLGFGGAAEKRIGVPSIAG